MKFLFALLFTASLASAGELADTANLFGADAPRVKAALKDLPVWIETQSEPPAGITAVAALNAHYGARATQIASNGFYVVITRQPRLWVIAMNPQGQTSPALCGLAGHDMVVHFDKGQFANGAIYLAKELTRFKTENRAGKIPGAQCTVGTW